MHLFWKGTTVFATLCFVASYSLFVKHVMVFIMLWQRFNSIIGFAGTKDIHQLDMNSLKRKKEKEKKKKKHIEGKFYFRYAFEFQFGSRPTPLHVCKLQQATFPSCSAHEYCADKVPNFP